VKWNHFATVRYPITGNFLNLRLLAYCTHSSIQLLIIHHTRLIFLIYLPYDRVRGQSLVTLPARKSKQCFAAKHVRCVSGGLKILEGVLLNGRDIRSPRAEWASIELEASLAAMVLASTGILLYEQTRVTFVPDAEIGCSSCTCFS
jgi:hypothetical protein